MRSINKAPLHRNLHYHLLDLLGHAVGQARHVAIVGEEDGEVAGAEAEGEARARLRNVKPAVTRLVVIPRRLQELNRAATDLLRAREEELDVGVLNVRLVSLRVRRLRLVLAGNRFHAMRQKGRAVVHRQHSTSDEIQRRVQRVRQAFIQGNVSDMIVNHSP